MLNSHDIRSTVDGVILEVVKISGSVGGSHDGSLVIEPQMNLNRDFGLDSLDILELVSALEERFDIEMSDDVFEAVSTVDDLYRYLSVTLAVKS